MTMNENGNRASPASILAKLNKGERSTLRIYIGAAAGVGRQVACPARLPEIEPYVLAAGGDLDLGQGEVRRLTRDARGN